MKFALLSYPINEQTPTYGNKNNVLISSDKAIGSGDSVNESRIELPLHAGTHIDFPRHFYFDGQTLEDYPISYWMCSSPALVEVEPHQYLVKEEIIEKLEMFPPELNPDIILIKVKGVAERQSTAFWEYNYGLHRELAIYIRTRFPGVRLLGINSISLTSFQHRDEGRKAHLEFLNPEYPILIIEDMDLSAVNGRSLIKKIMVIPLRVNGVDGVPVSIIAEINN